MSALVTADGTIVAGSVRGSIHKVGAGQCRNPQSCNGWTFWHFELDGQLFPLEALRTGQLPPPRGSRIK